MTTRSPGEPADSRSPVAPAPAPLPFSLLLAVYAGDSPEFLRRAFVSSVHEQVRRPAEVVLVQDGPVSAELAVCMDELCRAAPIPVTRLRLQVNGGLARALEAGLATCRHEVVARMDADDVSLPERFARQLPEIEDGADLVGAALLEIGDDEQEVVGRRTPPTSRAVIERTARLHDPFNHPTVVYRRSAVAAAGGYQHLPQMEDYSLFARMIAAGARTTNCAEALLLYRVGAGAYERRGGRALLRAEITLQVGFLRSGFTTPAEFLRNVFLRGVYRLVPAGLRRRAYRLLVATRGERLEGRVQGPAPRRACCGGDVVPNGTAPLPCTCLTRECP